jgi:CheY-like chemotaxis protein
VLVVDDHASARESMADVLQHAGHDVRCCSSAVEALKQLDRWSADVIVTDLKMPGMNGIEFIRALSARSLDAQIVMVTAHATVASAVDAMRLGAFDYIEKPFGVDQLEQLVAGPAAWRQGACRSPASRTLRRRTGHDGSSAMATTHPPGRPTDETTHHRRATGKSWLPAIFTSPASGPRQPSSASTALHPLMESEHGQVRSPSGCTSDGSNSHIRAPSCWMRSRN